MDELKSHCNPALTNEVKMKRNEIFTIPNLLSLIRILLLPVVVYFYAYKQQYMTGVIIMFFCELTDFFDGYLARKLNQITRLGGILDPISDKLSQLVMCLCVCNRFPVIRSRMFLFIAKEFIAFIIGLFIVNTDYDAKAKWHGKVNTVFFDITLGLHMLWWDIPPAVTLTLAIISAILMVFSGVTYYISELSYLYRLSKQKN